MQTPVFNYHAHSDVSWICCSCGLPNFSTSLFESFVVDTSNPFESLSTSNTSMGSTSEPGSPLHTSSPKKGPGNSRTKQHSFRIISLNLQSIRAKKASLMNLVDSANPDIVVGTETWLRPDVHDSEFLPPGYVVRSRRDRVDGYGGVIIMTKSSVPCDELYKSKQSELAAVTIRREDNPPLIVAGLYRPPNGDQSQAEQACSEIMDLVRSNNNAPFWLTGDFNLPDISWSTNTTSGNQNPLGVSNAFLSTFPDSGLQQMVDFPTRNTAVLDLFLTNHPSLINRLKPLPGISDHEAIFIDSDVQVKLQRPTRRKIYLWTKADIQGLRNSMDTFSQGFTTEHTSQHPVESLWTSFKSGCLQALDANVPSKMTTQRYSQPWITKDLKRLSRRKHRAYNRYLRTHSARDHATYKRLKNETLARCKERYHVYVNDVIMDENHRPKRLWSRRMDSCGVAPLKRDGIAYSDAKVKAEILNDQFTSVFTTEDPSKPLPDLGPSPHPTVADITVQQNGVLKLLQHLNPHKATGPDEVSARLLKETTQQVAPALTLLFQASLDQGTIPEEWKAANITPLFKKGDRSAAVNYRPVSLTSVCSKVMEHIVHSQIITHMDEHGLLTDSQHGFRKRRSTETQLILSINDLAQSLDVGEQVDCILLDFSKAFDKVPHNRLLMKLHHYGVRGHLYDWIASFLLGRSQQVVLDGQASSVSTVSSGVPQGTVLGPLLFLLFINDLPSSVTSTTRLFADDCLLYIRIKSPEDQVTIQKDLNSLQQWEDQWLMAFNPDKCELLRVTNKRSPLAADYTIHGQVLNITDSAKYLGLNIHKSLTWDDHVGKITKKANSTIAFLSRNISRCPTNIKAQCYTTLVRPTVEYASSVWNPAKKDTINKIEAVQRRAARFATRDYQRTSSVTSMLRQLQWQSLQSRRETAQVTMMYRIVYHLVDIPADQYLHLSSLRTRGHQLRFLAPHTRTTVYRTAFFPQAIRLWNQLPACVVGANTLDSFKAQLSRANTN